MIKADILKPALYLIPTPIGNKDDITVRALKTLAGADILACEDTRHTGQLLKTYKINSPKMVSCHEHNEKQKAVYLCKEIESGKAVAFVSDAGSPGISDPGFEIIREAISRDIPVINLPGATAFVPALVGSGLANNRFTFAGFPPQKRGRIAFLEELSKYKSTVILYESPHRIVKLLTELIELCGIDRKVAVAREISKLYEEIIRGTLPECLAVLEKKDRIKGEFVLVLAADSESI